MTLTERLLNVALMGAEWVLWLLIALSVVSFGLMLERVLAFRASAIDPEALRLELQGLFSRREVEKARVRLAQLAGRLEADVLLAGLARVDFGHTAVREAMTGAKIRGRARLRQNLSFLATLGNNAPFIGLFGTVLGIVKAFHDLSGKKGQGPEVVMGSLSEALVATAVGLLVALPAVVAFNYFQGRLRERVANAEALEHDLLSELEEGPHHERAQAAPATAEVR